MDDAARLQRQRQDPRRLWRLFWALARPYFRHAPGARANFAWVVALGAVRSALSVLFSFISRDFWTALQKKDVRMFWRQISLFAAVLVLALPVLVWYSYAKDRMALRWRKWHTEKVLGDYFAKRNYYELDQRGTVDNPDQRIADDVSSFTSSSLALFMNIFTSTLDLVNFSVILLSIYARLFIVLISYSTVGTCIAIFIGRRLINLNFMQLQREADFRYSLIRVRENAESIAFYKGEPRERSEIERRLGAAVDNLVDLIVWSRNLSFFTTPYSYIIQILPLTIIAPLYFSGTIELGVVSQSQQAFQHILEDLSLIVTQFESLSSFSAGIDRLGELEEFLNARFAEAAVRKALERQHDDPDYARSSIGDSDTDGDGKPNDDDEVSEDGDVADFEFARTYGRAEAVRRYKENQADPNDDESELLRAEAGAVSPSYIRTNVVKEPGAPIVVENLTLLTPDGQHRMLFEELSFRLEHGQRLLIQGPSGTGKSSALRALAGLWDCGSGTISRPPLESMFFLPQRPYCTLGTLREQLVYPIPVTHSTATDKDLMMALELVDLEELPSRMGSLDVMRDWASVLSLGEQQRLAFARLAIGKPKLAILDECSSALDVDSEKRLYSHLQNGSIGYISVGHRPTLIKYHDVMLRFTPGGRSFSLVPITPDMHV